MIFGTADNCLDKLVRRVHNDGEIGVSKFSFILVGELIE
jgi:hypothetical protein